MTDTETAPDPASAGQALDFKLEVVVLPVADADRAKAFYSSLGWREDADFATDSLRVIQFTPPGSEASIIFGDNVTAGTPGAVQDLQLTVYDIDKARADLVARGVEVSEIFHDEGGVFHHAGTDARVSGAADGHADYGSWVAFSDPDGNSWRLQEIKVRLPGRVATATRYADAPDLAEALRRAAAAHGEHEARTGEADANWPDWYAKYMVAERAGEPLPQ